MALQKSYTKEIIGQSFTFDSAYFNITYLSGSKYSRTIGITM